METANRTESHLDDCRQSWLHFLNISVNLFYLVFGNIGNLLKIIFFLQKPLRHLPCSAFILCSTMSDFLTLNNLPIRQLLIHIYPNSYRILSTIDWSSEKNSSNLSFSRSDLLICKTFSYFHMLSIDFSAQMLVFASINRFCFSYWRKKRLDENAFVIRVFCYYPNVQRLCLTSFLICACLSFQHVLNFHVVSTSRGCAPRLKIAWTAWILMIHTCLWPMFMIVLGILTLKNLRELASLGDCVYRRSRHGKQTFIQICSNCIFCRNSVHHQIENQLTSMIIGEIFMTVLSSLPYGIYAFLNLFYRIEKMNNEWIPFFVRISMYLEASCGFYIYLLTLSSLRKRFWKMFHQRIRLFVQF